MNIKSTYLTPVFKHYERLLKDLCKRIEIDRDRFDVVAFSGMSGAMVAPMVAQKLLKNFVLVRKENESRHSSHQVEGMEGVKRYVIIDDGIDSGKTIDRILTMMKIVHPLSFCYKIYLYNQLEVSSDSQGNHYRKIPIVYV